MAASEEEICNLALSWLASDPITSIDDEGVPAQLCKANYALVRDAVLEERAWTFATARRVLPAAVDTPDWGYGTKFLLPSDCIRTLLVSDSEVSANENQRLDHRREGNYILADADTLYLKYIKRVTDVTEFSSTFVQALAQRLASDLAIPLVESRELQEQYFRLYQSKLAAAASLDGMQGGSDRIRTTRLLRAR